MLRSFPQSYQPSPEWPPGRPARCPFRGLLGVHSRSSSPKESHLQAITYHATVRESLDSYRSYRSVIPAKVICQCANRPEFCSAIFSFRPWKLSPHWKNEVPLSCPDERSTKNLWCSLLCRMPDGDIFIRFHLNILAGFWIGSSHKSPRKRATQMLIAIAKERPVLLVEHGIINRLIVRESIALVMRLLSWSKKANIGAQILYGLKRSDTHK
jgi:hypothetical protein